MGKRSLSLLKKDYSIPEYSIHKIIPHGLTRVPSNVSVESAYQKINVKRDSKLILSFGSIRNGNELDLLLKGFAGVSVRDKCLVTAGKVTWPSKKSLKFYKHVMIHNLRNDVIINDKFIPNDKVQNFMMPASVVVIPRMEGLNSGTIPLAFGFGKVVVGPEVGVMGEILEKTGNPTYNPNKIETLSEAIEKGVHLDEKGKGNSNKRYALENWRWSKIAECYINMYDSIL